MLPPFVIILLVTALLTKAINFSNGKAGEQAMDNSLWIVAILVIFLALRISLSRDDSLTFGPP